MLARVSKIHWAVCAAAFLAGCAAPHGQQGEVLTVSFDTPTTEAYSQVAPVEVDSGWREVPSTSGAQGDEGSQPQMDAQGLFELAKLKSEEGSHEESLGYFFEAASLGSAEAHYELAKIYTRGESVEKDATVANHHLNAAASLGYAEAYRVLGWQLIRGDNGPADVDSGLALMLMAAESSVRAQRELGMMYAGRYPFGINDVALAKTYLMQATQAGDAEGAYELGLLLRAEGDFLGAIAALGQAADSGHTKAKELLSALDPAPVTPH